MWLFGFYIFQSIFFSNLPVSKIISHVFYLLSSLWKDLGFRPTLAIMSTIPQAEHEAVEMAVDYEFELKELPQVLQDKFPKKLVDTTTTPGKKIIKLKKGEQGWRVQTNENLGLSRCTFERDSEVVGYGKSTSGYH